MKKTHNYLQGWLLITPLLIGCLLFYAIPFTLGIKVPLVRKLSKRQEAAMEQMIESSRDFSRWFGDKLEGMDRVYQLKEGRIYAGERG